MERLRDEIAAAPGERITFARFMQRALTEPGLGYYAVSDARPTRTGDFLTAPELHPFFGRCIGRFVKAAQSTREAAPEFRVCEYGAGRGTLRDSATSRAPAASRGSVSTCPTAATRPVGSCDLVIANEYLDALPVHRLVYERRLREAWVGWADGWFSEVIDEPSTSELPAYLEAGGVELRPGSARRGVPGGTALAGAGGSEPASGWRRAGHRLRP